MRKRERNLWTKFSKPTCRGEKGGFSLYSGTSLPLRASDMGNFGCVEIIPPFSADFLTEDKSWRKQPYFLYQNLFERKEEQKRRLFFLFFSFLFPTWTTCLVTLWGMAKKVYKWSRVLSLFLFFFIKKFLNKRKKKKHLLYFKSILEDTCFKKNLKNKTPQNLFSLFLTGMFTCLTFPST